MPLIYIVDDEPNIRQLVALALQDAGMDTQTYGGGEGLLHDVRRVLPDLIILDWMMPGMNGLDVIRALRTDERTRTLPIILLTAKTDELDRVLGLEMGADDYIPKPFGVRELAARVRALLRRRDYAGSVPTTPVLTAGGLTLDSGRRRVTKNGEEVNLTLREFDLLNILMSHPGQVFSRDQLLDRVWNMTYFGDTRTVDVHIRYLRQKIETDPSAPVYIETVRGVGYRFAEDPAEDLAE